ncbi:hypothetical protein K3172_03240 [Qipengyuania sp. 6B39]|uniref:TrbI/VirB10 family protein n=1 Tax=Qipengyuania proteolytica TaxID=2867239 RepID=UPI001C8A267B|nr:TrbI/VirB10 family protein [Qipengyuania proteolytica]MBX7494870.1 hypothetical protein [Qipengyuania proteolytica]
MASAAENPDTADRSRTVLSVRPPRAGLPDWAWIALAGLAGLGVFSVLAGQRGSGSDSSPFAATTGPAIVSPPPLVLPLENAQARPGMPPFAYDDNPRPAPPYAVVRQEPMAPALAPSYAAPAPRPVADYAEAAPPMPYEEVPPSPSFAEPSAPVPALVLDRGVQRNLARAGSSARKTANAEPGMIDPDGPLRPEVMARGPFLLPSGRLIPAVLETPVDTSRGGPVRALVSSDVRGFDGREVLIAKGSSLLGEYAAGAENGKRVLINWNRILLPDGRQVRIDYPSTDRNGTAGVEGKVHNNTLGRFAGAVLQTALNTASFGLMNRVTSGTVVVGAPVPQVSQAGQQVSRRRITIPAGTVVNAFVNHPIDFADDGA